MIRISNANLYGKDGFSRKSQKNRKTRQYGKYSPDICLFISVDFFFTNFHQKHAGLMKCKISYESNFILGFVEQTIF